LVYNCLFVIFFNNNNLLIPCFANLATVMAVVITISLSVFDKSLAIIGIAPSSRIKLWLCSIIIIKKK